MRGGPYRRSCPRDRLCVREGLCEGGGLCVGGLCRRSCLREGPACGGAWGDGVRRGLWCGLCRRNPLRKGPSGMEGMSEGRVVEGVALWPWPFWTDSQQ